MGDVPRESSSEGQRGLCTGMPHDWRTQTLCAQGPREKGQCPRRRAGQTCLLVLEGLLRRGRWLRPTVGTEALAAAGWGSLWAQRCWQQQAEAHCGHRDAGSNRLRLTVGTEALAAAGWGPLWAQRRWQQQAEAHCGDRDAGSSSSGKYSLVWAFLGASY